MDARRYRIVYEDDWLIVVDKPSGMLVIPTPKHETNTLTHLLNRDFDLRGIDANAYPCHRLDRETSGLIVYAKGKHAQKLMMDEFRKRAVKKVYVAVVQGIVKKSFDVIRGSIYNKNKRREESAVTKYKVLQRKGNFAFADARRNFPQSNKGNFSVLEVEPITGRTNQIRIQLASIGHPILGERIYAFRKDFKLRFKRTALHAKYIEFAHPVTKKRLDFTSPLAEDMERLLGGI